jgi:hypothetical protein
MSLAAFVAVAEDPSSDTLALVDAGLAALVAGLPL